jgi:hypothetical protein
MVALIVPTVKVGALPITIKPASMFVRLAAHENRFLKNIPDRKHAIGNKMHKLLKPSRKSKAGQCDAFEVLALPMEMICACAHDRMPTRTLSAHPPALQGLSATYLGC